MPGNCLGRPADFSKLSFCWVSSKPFCWRAVKMVPVQLDLEGQPQVEMVVIALNGSPTSQLGVVVSFLQISIGQFWATAATEPLWGMYALGHLEHEESPFWWVDGLISITFLLGGKKRKGYRNTETQVWKSSTAVVVIMKICNNYWNLYEDCDTESNKSQDIPLGKGKCPRLSQRLDDDQHVQWPFLLQKRQDWLKRDYVLAYLYVYKGNQPVYWCVLHIFLGISIG